MLTKLMLCAALALSCTAIVLLRRKDSKRAEALEHARKAEADRANALGIALDKLQYDYFCSLKKQISLNRAMLYHARRADALQRRLSTMTCPMNDHIWDDSGVCRKCGVRSIDLDLERMRRT